MTGMPPDSTTATPAVQRFGNFLAAMVMPSLGVFVAWGMLAALVAPTGWFPSPDVAELIQPIMTYALPLLIGFTGGSIVHGVRGGAIGALATMGVVVGADVTMVIGAMVMGPTAAWLLKKIDSLMEGRAKAGFEMLLASFSMGILGVAVATAAHLAIGPAVQAAMVVLTSSMNWIVGHHLLPLLAIPVAPAQMVFANNAINFGIMMPLGLEQVAQSGKSILFLVDANPGPSVGTLLAISLFGKGSAKRTAPLAALVAGVGGIGEVYFPFVLMKPKLILATMGGIATSLALFAALGGGTTATPSPGSVLMMVALSPSNALLANLIGFFGGMVVSLLIGFLLLRWERPGKNGSEVDLPAKSDGDNARSGAAGLLHAYSATPVHTVVVACDAGMGSSAMGSSILRDKLRAASLQVDVRNSKIEAIPRGVDLIVTHTQLSERARQLHDDGRTRFMTITNFLEGDQYDDIVEYVRRANSESSDGKSEVRAEALADPPSDAEVTGSPAFSPEVLNASNVELGGRYGSKEAAINAAGQILVRQGYVLEGYVAAMQEREKVVSVYVGNNVAVPHGNQGSGPLILKSGVSVVQVPEGVAFGDDVAYVLFGIAGAGEEHLQILSRIAKFCSEPANVQRLRQARTSEELVAMIVGE